MTGLLRGGLSLALLLLVGCGLLLDTDSRRDATTPSQDASLRDSALDSALPYPDVGPDAPTVDAFVPSLCDPFGPEGLVAHYTFDADLSGVIFDDAGGRDGMVTDGVIHVPGFCGDALKFGSAATVDGILPHARIGSDVAFALPSGSIEFFLRAPSPGISFGVLGRDATGPEPPGHLTVFVADTGHLLVRSQGPDETDVTSRSHYLCSAARLPVDAWVHVLINFGVGGAELFVDDMPADPTRSDVMLRYARSWPSFPIDCGMPPTPIGFESIAEPWFIGAASIETSPEFPEQLQLPFTDGAIDELRIRSVRLTPSP